jgi:hypothetical protein
VLVSHDLLLRDFGPYVIILTLMNVCCYNRFHGMVIILLLTEFCTSWYNIVTYPGGHKV